MEIKTKTALNNLTRDTVTLVHQNYIVDGDTEYTIGDEGYNSYLNCPGSRTQLKKVLSEDYYNAVISVWGEEM